MFKKMKHMKNEKGLTLIELLAVIVILAIVAAIAIPAIGSIINNQRDKAIVSDVSGMVSAAKIAAADGACGADYICTYDATASSTTNEIEYKSTKVTAGTVDLSDTSNPKIYGVTLVRESTAVDPLPFKGKYKNEFIKIKNATQTAPLTEANLNELMETGKTTVATPTTTP